MIDTDPENPRQTAARKRAKSASWRSRLFSQPPLEGGSRKWAWGFGAVTLLLLMAFVSGVRVGKELGSPPAKTEASVFLRDKPGERIPIQIAEAAKDSPRETEAPLPVPPALEKTKSREDAETRRKEKAAPSEKGPGPRTKPPPAPAAQPKPSAPAKSRYTLQIAALTSADEARELVKKLKGRGYDAFTVTGTAAAKDTLHRVRVGSFASLQEARQFAVEFEKKEKIKTIIVSP